MPPEPSLSAPAALPVSPHAARADDHAHEALPEGAVCASCGTALHGPYCHACGEKRLGPHDYALAHWLEHAVDAFTHFDLKVPKSLWSLLRRPGRMTADVLAGRRRAWATPFQTFLIANLLYYLVATLLQLSTFETPLRYHVDTMEVAARLTEARLAARGVTMAAYAAEFDALAHTLSKSLVVLFVPLFALVFGLLHLRPRRYALEHVAAGLHFTSLTLLMIVLPFPLVLLGVALGLGTGDSLWTLATFGLFGFYAARFFRRVYADRPWIAAAKALAVPFAFYGALMFLYRPLLFFVVHALL